MISEANSRSSQIALALNRQRTAFKEFLIAKVGSEVEADDILQNGLLKALRHGNHLKDDSKLEAWFYRVLRNALIDHYRAKAASRRRNEILSATVAALGEDLADAPPAWNAQICACIHGVIESLKPDRIALLRQVHLAGGTVEDTAAALGVSPNSASVTLHRARSELRKKLMVFCGACAKNACLDCSCEPTEGSPP